jgi:hypothetical protein
VKRVTHLCATTCHTYSRQRYRRKYRCELDEATALGTIPDSSGLSAVAHPGNPINRGAVMWEEYSHETK